MSTEPNTDKIASEPWCCARCQDTEEATGGPFVAICRHVAEAGGEEEEVVIFTDRGRDGVERKHCGDRDCPTVQVCDVCWDNLYISEAVDAEWIARAFGQAPGVSS